MPKMKTRKCAAKRLKRTGTGKYRYAKAGRRHIQSKKMPNVAAAYAKVES
jgi:large subunit ribosomal protein L35